ncbi:MAG: PGF-CTERM sorting domain-containing protein [Candidatus Hadarchaeota archaeon]
MNMRLKLCSILIILMLVAVTSISIGSSQLMSGDKFEPNDNMETAQKIEVGNSYNNLHVNQSDVDYYYFTASKSGTYIVETYESGTPLADTRIEILLSDGRFHEYSSDNGTGNFSKTMTSVILTNGNPTEIYVKVTEESNGEGYYGIKVSYNSSTQLGEGAQGDMHMAPGFEWVFATIGLLTSLYLFKRKEN